MTYIGKGLYSKAQFEDEAKENGVARAMPARVVHTLKWGDAILVAQWLPDREKQDQFKQEQMSIIEGEEPKKKFRRFGAAEVFGYFNVTGLNMNAPDEMKKMLASRLKVTGMIDHGPAGKRVTRRCGSYGVAVTYFVEDTIAEILDKAAEVEKEVGAVFKWFVTGKLERIEPNVTLDPAKFSRGVVKVDVEGDLFMQAGKFSPGVSFIFNYERKSYQPKKEDQ